MSYNAASQTVRDVGTITSREKYWKWWDAVQPTAIPKYPYRVYPEWTTWGDFCGHHNSFDTERKGSFDKDNGRPYWDAVRWCQKQNFDKRETYRQAHADGDVPVDIPKYPEKYYSNFWVDGGWKTWLGKTIDRKILSAENVVGLYCLFQSSYQPPNVLEVITFPEGVDQGRKFVDNRPDLRMVKTYIWDRELSDTLDVVLHQYASQQDRNVWLIPNVNALLFELDNLLMVYRP